MLSSDYNNNVRSSHGSQLGGASKDSRVAGHSSLLSYVSARQSPPDSRRSLKRS